MCFNQKPSAPVANYTLSLYVAKPETAHESKYLGVMIQSDLKFTTHIKQKVVQAKQQRGLIKRALYGTTKSQDDLIYDITINVCKSYPTQLFAPVALEVSYLFVC